MAAAELAALPELVVLRVLELLPLRDRLRAARWGPGRHRAPFSGPTLELCCCEIPSLWFFGSDAPRLQRLELHNVPAFSDRHLLNVSSHGHLRTLSLLGTYRVTDMGMERAAPHLEGLEHLELQHCVLTDSALHFIAHHMKRLRVLEITSIPHLTDLGLASLAALEHLEVLHLDLYNKFSLRAVAALCRALPRLRSFTLDGVHSEDETMGEIRVVVPRCSFTPPPRPQA